MNAFDEETHTYTINGIKVPSVTEVIENLLGASWYTTDFYLQRGSAVHVAAKFIAQEKLFEYDKRIEGYVKALKLFFKEVNPTVIKVETQMFSTKFSFGGTLDLVGKISNKIFIFDFKNSYEKQRLTLQLGAYSLLYEETFYRILTNGLGVKLANTGKYSLSENFDLKVARREFLALRTSFDLKKRINGEK